MALTESQVCINQKDIPERNSQVRQMADIYKKSASLAIWLGECEGLEAVHGKNILSCLTHQHEVDGWYTHKISTIDGAPLPICFIRAAIHPSRAANGRPRAGQARNPSPVHRDWIPSSVRNKLTPEQIHVVGKAFLKSMSCLLNRRYFKRRWVIQEIFHSDPNYCRVYWGEIECDFLSFVKTCKWLSGLDNRILRMVFDSDADNDWRLPWRDFDKIERIVQLKSDFGSKEPIAELCLYLQKTVDAECSDPRDRLFALLSMLSATVVSSDYSRSLLSVCMELSTVLVENGYVYELCTAAGHQAMKGPVWNDVRHTVPTWCIDIRSQVWFFDDIRLKRDPPLPARVEGETLYCDVRVLGVMSERYMHLPQPDRDERIVYAPAADLTAKEGRPVGLISPQHDSTSFASGDLLCSLQEITPHLLVSRPIVLRIVPERNEWIVVGTCLMGLKIIGGHVEGDIFVNKKDTILRTMCLK